MEIFFAILFLGILIFDVISLPLLIYWKLWNNHVFYIPFFLGVSCGVLFISIYILSMFNSPQFRCDDIIEESFRCMLLSIIVGTFIGSILAFKKYVCSSPVPPQKNSVSNGQTDQN